MKFIKLSFLLFLLIIVSACSDSSNKRIKVGSEGAYKPFSYVGKDGEMMGYDVDVLRILQEIDSSLDFEFKNAPWNALFLGLDSGRFDLLANQIIKTQEREEKYLFTTQSYFVSTSQFVARSDDETIKSVADLSGKVAGCVVGSAHTKILEDWNAKNGNILEIRYYKDLIPLLQDLVNKRIDVHLNDPASIADIIKEQNLSLKVLDERISQSPVYLVFRKEDSAKALITKIDSAILKAKESGKLSELSMKYFGVDQSK